jgi:hypothetical protein
MQQNSKHIINLENIDHYLGSMGFLYPVSECQLEIFNIVYAEFDFKLKDVSIDASAIINNQLSKKSVFNIFKSEQNEEIQELKMVARKGSQLPQDIIDKMYGKHRKSSDDKE